jgi:hypothetical protein
MVDTKILIGVVTGEYARRADFYDYYNTLDKPKNCMAMFAHDRSPAHGRNIIIEQALANECSHVLFIDDDMAFKPASLNQLMEHDVDVVSGLYLRREYPHQPLTFDYADEDGKCLYSYLDGNEERLRKIVAAGFGFLLVKTLVFQRMEKPWIRLGELDPQEWCDDIGFFHRARKAGFEFYCDMECRIGHIGSMILWPNKQDGQWFTGYDTGSSKGMINTPQINPDIVYGAANETSTKGSV